MPTRSTRRWRHAAATALVFAAAAVTSDNATAQDAAKDARKVLAEHGLVNLGDAWLVPAEVEVRRWLEALDPLERQHQVLQRAVDERVAANESAKAELKQKQRELKKINERIEANDAAALGPTREQLKQSAKELETHIARLRKQYKDGTRLAEYQPARDEVVRLANARAGLTLAATALRRRLNEMPAQYDRVAKSPAVRAALLRLGPSQQLGAGRNYAAETAERLTRIDRATLSNVAPIYRDDNHARVLAIVNDAAPVTFSLRHSNGPSHLPHSLVTSLDLPTDDAPQVTYTVGNRKLACRRVKLASVRIGGFEMRDVEALALPPEGEDLGAKLGRAAYASHYFDVDFSRLRLTIMTSAPQENGAKPAEPRNDGSNSAARSPTSRPLGQRTPRGR